MNPNIQHAVFDFIENQLRVRPDKIALDKSLNLDLGMDGDDAVEFFEAFAEKFHVDLVDLAYEWDLYFGPEGIAFSFGPPDGFLTLFTARPQPPGGRMVPLTIERVVRAAETDRWEKLPTA